MAVAHVQTTKTVDNSGGTSITSGSMTLTAGNLALFAALEFGAFGSALPVPTSAKLDNTTAFTQDLTFEANTSSNFRMRVTLYSMPNVSGGSHSVTVAHSGNIPSNVLYFFMEVSGALTTAAVDGTGASASGVSTAAASGSASSTNSDDFWIAATTSLAANPATFAAGSGWTIPTNGTETNSSSNLCGGVEYMANPGATSENGQFTLKSGDWVCGAIAYKAAAGGGATAAPNFITLLGAGA
jgi:hypothetical protein